MKFVETELPGMLIVEPTVYDDERGFFMETHHRDTFAAAGIRQPFVQDNHSHSIKGVLRGLHYQLPRAQGKLVRVVSGRIFDVAVDIRKGSPTFRHWVRVELSDQNRRQVWVPPGFAHGYCTLSDNADVLYKCTEVYAPEFAHSIAWNDPDIGIEWPIDNPLLSNPDRSAPRLRDATILPE